MKKFLKSFSYALRGIGSAVREERNLKVQLAIAAVTVIAAFYFSVTPVEWCIILFFSALVLALELVNTALENLVDLITPERKIQAGKVKDAAAGAVLVAATAALIAGASIFWKYLLALF